MIQTYDDFHAKIARECDRAERYKLRLSLAVFELSSATGNKYVVRHFVQALYRRFRDVDDLGWFSTNQLGVLLPHTPAQGAWKLAEDVVRIMSSVLPDPPPFTIFSFPSVNWPQTPKKNIWQRFLGHIHSQKEKSEIASVNEMHANIILEVDRAARYDYVFSLIIYDLNKIETDQSQTAIKKLVKTMHQRLRDSDSFGWYEDGKLGIILPFADQKNAEKVSRELCQASGIAFERDQMIATFPDNWDHHVNTEGLRANTVPQKSSVQDTNKKSRAPKTTAGKSASHARHTEGAAMPPREPLALDVRPLPQWKRTEDLVISAILLVVFSPLMLTIALIIKRVSPGPVLFRQLRPGFKRKPFEMLKFRTMHVDADMDLHKKYLRKLTLDDDQPALIKVPNDPRIFPFGRILRKASLDELPQLINVLRGEMSLVGPRPPLMYEAEKYQMWHARRFDVLPGLTGLWQVYGKNRLTFEEMIRLDLRYEKRFSFWLDLKILFLTLPAIISHMVRDDT